MTLTAAKEPDVSVIVATYNRGEILRGTLESLRDQENDEIDYEVIVVDNNSTDDTQKITEELFRNRAYDNFSYYLEPKQGVSYARNKGVVIARAPIIAFTDDDIRPTPNWVASLHKGFRKFPDVDCIGGRVLPDRETRFPDWVNRDYWTPLALLDLGDERLELDVKNGAGLVGANLAIRASVFKQLGFFSPQLQRVKDGIGSLEDHEYQLRMGSANKRLMYLPELVVYAHVPEERLCKSYHRRWYYGHGHFYAVMRDDQFESSKFKLFDVPAHLYRRTLSHAIDWLKYSLTGRGKLEFRQELELQFFWGFFCKRFAERRSIVRFRP